MNLTNRKQKADRSKALLENQAFSEAFDHVEKIYTEKMINTSVSQREEREYYHICINALKDVKNVLTLQMQDGKIAEKELQKKAKRYKK